MADNLVLLDGGALPTLLTMADRDDARLVVTAVRIMDEVRDTRAIPTLVGLRERSTSVDVGAQAAAVLENFGYRQITAVWRVWATVDYLRGARGWGRIERQRLETADDR